MFHSIKLKIMKTKLLLLLTFFFCAASGVIAQNTDEDVVKKVLYAETETFMKRDAEAWQAFFMHDEKTCRTYTGNGFYQNDKGWSSFGPRFLQYMKDSSRPSHYTQIKNDNYIIRINGNAASVEYDQELSAPGYDSLYPSLTREYRTMIKDNNEWKITSLMSIDTASYTSAQPVYIENQLNNMGYVLLNNKKIKDAIEVFKLNVKLFPKSWNVYDSLGEAYADDGEKEDAIKNYEESVKINPQNDNGKKALEKLKQK
jgi:tetratricopeptide (TPR) repeat protein